MDSIGPIFAAVTPTICVGIIFWFVMSTVVHADRNERAAFAKIEAEEAARAARGEAPSPR